MSVDHDAARAAAEARPTPAAHAPAPEAPQAAAPAATLLAHPAIGDSANAPARQAALLQMQRAGGNRAVQRFLTGRAAHEAAHVQRRAAPGAAGGAGLPGPLQAGVESLSGLALDDVQVRYNSARPAELDALAYAEGPEIHVAPGQEQHLAHEAWHVVQQKQGRVQPTMQLQGAEINDDEALEAEADEMGARALAQPGPAPATLAAPAGDLAPVTQAKVIQRLNSAQKKLLDPIKAEVAGLATPQERWNRIKQALDAANAGTDINITDGAKYLKVVATKPAAAVVAAVGPATPFVSLEADEEAGLYTVATGAAKIRYTSGEKPFEAYSGGKSVDDAVEEAIAGLDLTGSISFKHSRHDFQPTSKDYNLQVQLGGSENYRVGKGDTSSTLVVVDTAVWNTLRADAPRLKLILQAAHRQSFTNIQKVELRPAQ
jgi:hypothetical protein